MWIDIAGSKCVACDTETTGLSMYGGDRPFAFSFTSRENKNHYVRFDVDPFTREVLYGKDGESYAEWKRLKAFYEDASITKIFHNANFDILMLKMIGIEVKGPIFDTMVLAHVYDPSRLTYQLKPLALQILRFPVEDLSDLKESVVKARREGKKLGYKLSEDVEGDYHLGDPILCEKYAVGDTDRTMMLFLYYGNVYYGSSLIPQDADYKHTVDMEMTLLEVVRRMMDRGHQVDLDTIGILKNYYETAMVENESKKAALGYEDLNEKSPKQMHKVFYDDLKMPPVYRVRKNKDGSKEKTRSVDSEALAKWASEGNELAGSLVELGACRHQLSSFILPFETNSCPDNDGNRILHPAYKTLGAITGRMSCTNPNLMNISDSKSGKRKSVTDYRARECFVPRRGHVLYYADYSQIEVWVAAFLSKDKILTQQLLDKADIHTINATNYWGNRPDFKENFNKYRKKAKTVTFGSLYGAGKAAIAAQAEVTEEEAARIHQIFWSTYSGLGDYGRFLQNLIRKQGYIKNPFGRRYLVHPDYAYKSLNYMVQGSSCEVLKRALIESDKLFTTRWPGTHLLMAIHDESVSETPMKFHSKRLMREIAGAMQGNYHEYFGLSQKFKIGMSFTTTNWSEKEEIEV